MNKTLFDVKFALWIYCVEDIWEGISQDLHICDGQLKEFIKITNKSTTIWITVTTEPKNQQSLLVQLHNGIFTIDGYIVAFYWDVEQLLKPMLRRYKKVYATIYYTL